MIIGRIYLVYPIFNVGEPVDVNSWFDVFSFLVCDKLSTSWFRTGPPNLIHKGDVHSWCGTGYPDHKVGPDFDAQWKVKDNFQS